jgi:NAD(P)-dependent dehydrogenase (short-subunit alcohol dehydrogenase family)
LKTIDETIIAIAGQKSSENVRAVQLDLSDLESVRKAAAEILEITPIVDVLINNAGIMSELSALSD